MDCYLIYLVRSAVQAVGQTDRDMSWAWGRHSGKPTKPKYLPHHVLKYPPFAYFMKQAAGKEN